MHPSSISSLSKSQPAFQSGSTPLTSTSTSSRRFLSFNDLGTLVSVKTEENYVIQFESFDVSKRRNFRMTDHFGYDLGNLGETGALLATSSNASGGLEMSLEEMEAMEVLDLQALQISSSSHSKLQVGQVDKVTNGTSLYPKEKL